MRDLCCLEQQTSEVTTDPLFLRENKNYTVCVKFV